MKNRSRTNGKGKNILITISANPDKIALPLMRYIYEHEWPRNISTEEITVHRINELLSDVTELRVLYNRIPKESAEGRENSEERGEFNDIIKNLIKNMEGKVNMNGYYLSYDLISHAFQWLVNQIRKMPMERLDNDFSDLKKFRAVIEKQPESDYCALVENLPLEFWQEFLFNEKGSVETILKYLLDNLRQSKKQGQDTQAAPAKE